MFFLVVKLLRKGHIQEEISTRALLRLTFPENTTLPSFCGCSVLAVLATMASFGKCSFLLMSLLRD